MVEIMESFKDKAFLGEKVKNTEWVGKMEEMSKKMDKDVFHSDEFDLETRAKNFLKEFNGDDSLDTYVAMDNFINSVPTTEEEEVKIAKINENMQLFGMVMYDCFDKTKDRKLKVALSGSLDDIRKVIPNAWYGSEELLRVNIIDDSTLVYHLDKLERLKGVTNFGDYREAASFVNSLEATFDELNKLNPSNKQQKEQLLKVIPYLKFNLDDTRGRMSIMNRERVKIPDNKDGQRKLAREQLTIIVTNKCKFGEIYVSNESRILSDMIMSKEVGEDVKAEIKMAIKTVSLAKEMLETGGFMPFDKIARKTVPSVFEDARANDYAFNKMDIEAFWGEKNLSNLPFREMWDKLQLINYRSNYKIILQQIIKDPEFLKSEGIEFKSDDDKNLFKAKLEKGIKKLAPKSTFWKDSYTNYQCDSDDNRKKLVENYMKYSVNKERESAGLSGYSKDDLSYALMITKLMNIGTAEYSKANIGLIGHQSYSETIMFSLALQDYIDHHKKGDPRVLNGVITIGNTYLGCLCFRDALTPILSKHIKPEYMDIPKSDMGYHSNIATKMGDVYQTLLEEKITPNDYLDPIVYKRIWDALTKVAKTPGTITKLPNDSQDVQERSILIDNFKRDSSGEIIEKNGLRQIDEGKDEEGNTVDKKGGKVGKIEQNLREILVSNMFKQISNNRNLGWTIDQFRQLKDMLGKPQPVEYYLYDKEDRERSEGELNTKLNGPDVLPLEDNVDYNKLEWQGQKKPYRKKSDGGIYDFDLKEVPFLDSEMLSSLDNFYKVTSNLAEYETTALNARSNENLVKNIASLLTGGK